MGETMTRDIKKDVPTVVQRVKKIHKLLHGLPPQVQGGILGDLVAIFIAGHDPLLRPMVRAGLIELIDNLVEPNEKIFFGEEGHPGRKPPETKAS
jgi:hypothetical protein